MPNQPIDSGFFDPTVPYPMRKTSVTIDPGTTKYFLFSRQQDPGHSTNLRDTEVGTRNTMLSRLKNILTEEGCPEEQLVRLDLEPV